ncbi:DHS-like NAD/FAD-binding domain-containing protein [Hypoxylon sp. FL1284]|nr:DHS-like NAD/FAD-binding domain-containing protein [Hypoxylon sp. FL1284]
MDNHRNARRPAHIGPGSNQELSAISDAISRAKNIVALTGAGISTSTGIPDYRSIKPYFYMKDGKTSRRIRTKELFHTTALSNESVRSSFFRYHTELRQSAMERPATPTHRFLRELCDRRQLLRNHTQNIDDLERKAGLCTDLERGVGVECVQLHGTLGCLRYAYCSMRVSWDEDDREAVTMLGQAPVCPSCSRVSSARVERGKRALNPGFLRPDIVLYDEAHVRADEITDIKVHDLSYETPDLLLVLGTRLRIPGVKDMVKEFARVIHARGGLVVYINLTASKAKEWDDMIDYWVEWDCDSWVMDLQRRNPDDHEDEGKKQLASSKVASVTQEEVAAIGWERRSLGSSAAFPIELTG